MTRKSLRAAVSAVAAVGTLAVSASLVPAASASEGYFCPPNGGTGQIGGSGRCVHGTFHSDTKFVSAYTANGDGVLHCAALKQFSDGSGGNQGINPDCRTRQLATIGCFGGTAGYATIINQSTSPHQFFGYFGFGSTGSCG